MTGGKLFVYVSSLPKCEPTLRLTGSESKRFDAVMPRQRADVYFEDAVKHWNRLEYNQAEACYKNVSVQDPRANHFSISPTRTGQGLRLLILVGSPNSLWGLFVLM